MVDQKEEATKKAAGHWMAMVNELFKGSPSPIMFMNPPYNATFNDEEEIIEIRRHNSDMGRLLNSYHEELEKQNEREYELSEEETRDLTDLLDALTLAKYPSGNHESSFYQIQKDSEIANERANRFSEEGEDNMVSAWDKIKTSRNPYRNALNREMKMDNREAIRANEGKHWQDKFEPESTEYYTRLCDGNYHKIGKSEELPEHIQGSKFKEMKEHIILLETLVENYKLNTPTTDKEVNKNIVKLIERSTNRAKHESKFYKDSYYREQERKNALITENRKLKEEIERLRKTGIFPVENKGLAELTDREKRFTMLDM